MSEYPSVRIDRMLLQWFDEFKMDYGRVPRPDEIMCQEIKFMRQAMDQLFEDCGGIVLK